MIAVRTNLELLRHLTTFEHDGGTVASVLFDGDRLSYPGRKEIEVQLGYTDPYTIDLEARVVEGLPRRVMACVRFLSREATVRFRDVDPTLELLWSAHDSWQGPVSLDRLVAALVMVEKARAGEVSDPDVDWASEALVTGLHAVGFPPDLRSLEELFDGAPPACVGLGLVEL